MEQSEGAHGRDAGRWPGGDVRGRRSYRTEEDGARRRARALQSLTETSGREDAGVEQSEALVHRNRMTERRSRTERRRSRQRSGRRGVVRPRSWRPVAGLGGEDADEHDVQEVMATAQGVGLHLAGGAAGCSCGGGYRRARVGGRGAARG
jgi:hypothetical protein